MPDELPVNGAADDLTAEVPAPASTRIPRALVIGIGATCFAAGWAAASTLALVILATTGALP